MSESTNSVPVTVFLDSAYSFLAGRVLSLDDIVAIYAYKSELQCMWGSIAPFNSRDGQFHNIWLYNNKRENKYSVWALDDTLKHGPEFYINTTSKDTHVNEALRSEVIWYLTEHPELNITIDDFL